MKTKLLILAMALVTASQGTPAKTLVISDIDDTIKMTDVLGSKPSVVYHGLITDTAFAGMSELYQRMSKTGALIYYVSGAPKVIKWRIKDFLEDNEFPQRRHYVLKNKISDDTYDYKVNAINELIAELKPSEIILIGDDTEFDPEVYVHISEVHPELVKAIYIRAVKNRQDLGEKSFFSPVEIGVAEVLQGRLAIKDLSSIANGFIRQTYDTGISLKHRYCPREGRVQIEDLKLGLTDVKAIELLTKTQKKIIRSCN